MLHRIDIQSFTPSPLFSLGGDFTGASPGGEVLSFSNLYPEKNGKPFIPVSGEFHYSRMDERRWEDELIKMRMGGIDIVSTYVFWNHIEEEEGVFDFSLRRDLRRFVTLCAAQGLYVILRVGPFAHGEVRNGGLPDWLYGKPFEVRSTDPGFMALVRRLYGRIGEEVKGLFFADGGPIIAVQLDNEYMHSSAPWEMTAGVSDEWVPAGSDGEGYILALRNTALECGLRPVFFTGTAWGGAAYSPRVLPLWGGYAYRPWIFYSHRGEHPATEEFVYQDYHHNGIRCTDDFKPAYAPEDRPYACCEMGAGMTCCYYYRFVYPFKSVDALANVKLGSGCNFPGYYMFHGGTNPLGKHGAYLNEGQVPRRSYDYQAALGEFGQVRESYRRLKTVHFFTRFFGERLSPMETVLPEGASLIDPGDTSQLRFALRTDGESGFLFINNFQDHRPMPSRFRERVDICTRKGTYPFDISIAPDENAILPFRFDMDGILLEQACAQPVLRTERRGRALYVFTVPEGMDGSFRFASGTRIRGDAGFFTAECNGREVDVMVLDREESDGLFLTEGGGLVLTDGVLLEDREHGLRLETEKAENTLKCWPADLLSRSGALKRREDRGVFGVYSADTVSVELCVETTRTAPHRWLIKIPEIVAEGLADVRLQIDYRGDIGMLFLGNELVSDNFCSGDVWEFGLLEYKERLSDPFVLVITPLREGVRVNAETAMAGRSESSEALTAALLDVRLQPVYRIGL